MINIADKLCRVSDSWESIVAKQKSDLISIKENSEIGIEEVYRGHRCEISVLIMLIKLGYAGFEQLTEWCTLGGSNTGKDIVTKHQALELKSTCYPIINRSILFIESKCDPTGSSGIPNSKPAPTSHFEKLFPGKPLFLLVHESETGEKDVFTHRVIGFDTTKNVMKWYNDNKWKSLELKKIGERNRFKKYKPSIAMPHDALCHDFGVFQNLMINA